MRATLMYAAGDVRVEDVPDPSIVEPTDAIIRVTSACVCGSDLWPYADLEPTETGRPMGHEAIGVVEDVGADVRTVKRGDLVVMPFAFSDGTCAFCHEGLHTACVHGGFFDGLATGAAQAEAVRVPLADGTLYALPVGEDDALMPSLLTLSDVLGTGHHAAVVRRRQARRLRGGRRRRRGRAVRRDRRQAARRRADHHHGPPRGPHRRWRASSAPPTSSPSAARRPSQRDQGAHRRLRRPRRARVRRHRAGHGDLGRDRTARRRGRPRRRPALRGDPAGAADVLQERQVGGGPAPVRAYIDELLPDILDGTIEPGRVFDRTVDLDGVPTATARWPTASRSRCC